MAKVEAKDPSLPSLSISEVDDKNMQITLNADKEKLFVKPRSETPELKSNLQFDISKDIEKIALEEDGEEAATEAKILQGKIDAQIELSFELMQQRQNEVKDFLRRRQLEEEEHKKKAGDIVKRLSMIADNDQKAIDDLQDHEKLTAKSNKNKATTASQTDGDYHDDLFKKQNVVPVQNSSSSQTEAIEQESQGIQVNLNNSYNDITDLEGRISHNELKPDDIPHVIEAIRDDLLDKLKGRIAEERLDGVFKLEDDYLGSKAQFVVNEPETRAEERQHRATGEDAQGTQGPDNNSHTAASTLIGEETKYSDSDIKKEIIDSLIDSRISNAGTPESVKNCLGNYKQNLSDAIFDDASDASKIASIPEEKREILASVYDELMNDYQRLNGAAGLGDNGSKGLKDDEKVNRCRKLCDQINRLEEEINDLQRALLSAYAKALENGGRSTERSTEELNSQKKAEFENATGNADINEILGGLSDDIQSNQVAGLGEAQQATINNGLLNRKQPALVDDNGELASVLLDVDDELSKLIAQKTEAELELASKLDDLQSILSGEDVDDEARKTESVSILPSEISVDAASALSEEMKHLQRNNKALQKNFERVSEENLGLLHENKQLKNNLQIEDAARNWLGPFRVLDEEICTPEWEAENRLLNEMETIKDKLGAELVNNLANKYLSANDRIENMDIHDYLVIDDQTLGNTLLEQAREINELSEQLTDASVANEITTMTTIDNPDTDSVIQTLQEEVRNVEELEKSNKCKLESAANDFQEAVSEKNRKLKERAGLVDKKQGLEKQLAVVNNQICRCYISDDDRGEPEAFKDKINEIDKEIKQLAREIEKQDKNESSGEMLEEILQLLEPYVNGVLKSKLSKDEAVANAFHVPDKSEASSVILEKRELLDELQNLRKQAEKINDEMKTSKPRMEYENGMKRQRKLISVEKEEQRGVSIQPSSNKEKKLGEGRDALDMISNNHEEVGLYHEDQEYLEEMVASLNERLVGIDEQLREGNQRQSQSSIEKLIAEIDLENDNIREQMEKLASSSSDTLSSAVAKENAMVASTHLQHEKERIEEVLTQAEQVGMASKDEQDSFANEFEIQYQTQTENIKLKVQNCMDKTIENIEDITDKLIFAMEEDDDLLEDEGYLPAITKEIERIKSDMNALLALEENGRAVDRDGQTIEIEDSEVEELAFKLEAQEVSLARLDKTIEEHLQNDGDPNTLDMLLKRKAAISSNISAVRDDLRKREADLKANLEVLNKEKERIEAKLSDDEIQLLMDMITEKEKRHGSYTNDAEEIGQHWLEELLKQREEAFSELNCIIRRDGLEQLDDQLRSLDSILNDISTRLEELDHFTEQDGSLRKETIGKMLAQKQELAGALDYLQNKSNVTERDLGYKSEDKIFSALRDLSKKKIDAINAKLGRIEKLREELEKIENEEDNKQNSSRMIGAVEDKHKKDEIIGKIKEQLAGLEYISKQKDIVGEITAKTIDEIQGRKKYEGMLKKLFDERDRRIEEYRDSMMGDSFDNPEEKQKQLAEIDKQIALCRYEEDLSSDFYLPGEKSREEGNVSNGSTTEMHQSLLAELIDNRDEVLRKLFELQRRNSSKKFTEQDNGSEISNLKEILENMLQTLDDDILRFTAASPLQDGRVRSPGLQVLIEVIAEEIASLEKELQEGRIFLHSTDDDDGAKLSILLEKDDGIEKGHGRKMQDLRARLEELEDLRSEVLLSDGSNKENDEELKKNKEDILRALGELESKLNASKRLQILEDRVEVANESNAANMSPEVTEKQQDNQKEANEKEARLETIDRKIIEYVLALEDQIHGDNSQKNEGIIALIAEDKEQVKVALKSRIDELTGSRMKLRKGLAEGDDESSSKNTLQGLIQKRKQVIKSLEDTSGALEDNATEISSINDIPDLKKEYNGGMQQRTFLQKKKKAIKSCLRGIEERDADSTSGFSDLSLHERKMQTPTEIMQEKESEIQALKESLESSQNLLEHLEHALAKAQKEIVDYENETKQENLLLNESKQEIVNLKKEIADLKDAMTEVSSLAQELDVENQRKLLEIENHKGIISELETKLDEMEDKIAKHKDCDGSSRDKKTSEELEKTRIELVKIKQEYEELKNKFDDQGQELEEETMKNKLMGEELQKLDRLKNELQSKGKQTVKVAEELQGHSTNASGQDFDDKQPNKSDLRYEMDKISATEEVMKLAAELIMENENKTGKYNDLRHEYEELQDYFEELLEKYKTQIAEQDMMKAEVAEKEVEMEKIRQDCKELVKNFEQMSDELKEKEKEMLISGKNIRNLETELNENKQETEVLKGENACLKEENKELQNDIRRLQSVQLELEKKIPNPVEEEIVAEEERNLMLEVSNDWSELEQQISILKEENMLNDGNLKTLKVQLQEREEEVTSLKKELEEAENRIEIMEADDKIIQETLTDHERRQKQFENRVSGFKSIIDEKDNLIDQINFEKLQNKKEISNLRSEINTLEDGGHELKQKVAMKSKLADTLAAKVDELKNELESLLQEKHEMEAKNREFVRKLTKERDVAESELNSNAARISDMENNYQLLDTQCMQKQKLSEGKMLKLQEELDEKSLAYEELFRNFNRLKKAKGSVISEYETQVRNMKDDMKELNDLILLERKKLQEEKSENANMNQQLENLKDRLEKQNKDKFGLLDEHDKSLRLKTERIRKLENEIDTKSEINDKLERKLMANEQGHKLKMQEKENEIDILREELRKKGEKVVSAFARRTTEDRIQQSEVDNNRLIHSQEELIAEAKKKMRKLKTDLEMKTSDNKKLLTKCEELQKKMKEVEENLNEKITEMVGMRAELERKLLAKDNQLENKDFEHKLSISNLNNAIMKAKRETEDLDISNTKLQKENDRLLLHINKYKKEVENITASNEKEQHKLNQEIKQLKMKIKHMQIEAGNVDQMLLDVTREKDRLKFIKNENQVQQQENFILKKRIQDMTEEYVRKDALTVTTRELSNLKDEYEKLKSESEIVIKYSKNFKDEVKRLKRELAESNKEHEKEQKLLIENLETEFRKRIEEMMRSHLKEKEELLNMWDEERENWERELEEQMSTSRRNSEKKLEEQKEDLEKEYFGKVCQITNETESSINKLNQDMMKLKNENLHFTKRYEEEKQELEDHYETEKKYMLSMIEELVRNLLTSKSRKNTMKRNHIDEISQMEYKYDKDKSYLDLLCQQEMQMLRDQLRNALSSQPPLRGHAYNSTTRRNETLDLIPRKLT